MFIFVKRNIMNAIEHNNKERLKEFGNTPASEMTKREKIAVEILTAIIGVEKPAKNKGYNDEAYDQCVESAITLTDKLIKKLCSND
jgi:hypothetical protein